jgi:hypothetical protein
MAQEMEKSTMSKLLLLLPCPRALLVALLLGAATGGCYNPKIEDGAFLCGSGGTCPEGFSCVGMRCFKSAANAPDGGGESDARQCSVPTGSTGACDPVCQTGCRMAEQCTNNGASNMCKVTPTPNEGLYNSCDPFQDACRPGLVCLPEFTDACGSHCYRFCREDIDCGENSRCVGEVADQSGRTLYKTCSPRGGNCNPTGTSPACSDSAPADRTLPNFACYIVSPEHPNESVCECAGSVAEGKACTRTYECVPGNECVPVGNDVRCRRLCTPPQSPLPPVACPTLQTCRAFPNSGGRIGFCVTL